MTVERARSIMGRAAEGLSDEEVARICRELDDYARLLIRIDAREQSEPVPTDPAPPPKGIGEESAAGKSRGGWKAGARWKVTPALERQVRAMREAGEPVSAISRAVSLSPGTIYELLRASPPVAAAP